MASKMVKDYHSFHRNDDYTEDYLALMGNRFTFLICI